MMDGQSEMHVPKQQSIDMSYIFLVSIIVNLICLSCAEGSVRYHHHPVQLKRSIMNSCYLAAFAGGGFGSTSKSIKKNTPNEAYPKKDKKRKRLFIDQDEIKDSTLKQLNEKPTSQPLLDRFGLPILTAENIFPPLPPGTEILRENISLQGSPIMDHIRAALQSHIPIHFDIFDSHGIEQPMVHENHQTIPARLPWKLKLLHYSPPVLYIENFLTPQECQECISLTQSESSSPHNPVEVNSATFASTYTVSKRTSTSWFCFYSSVSTFLAKAKRLLHLSSLDSMEEPQIVRYRTGEEFSWHYDEVPSSQLDNGGQRVGTLLVYLNTLAQGGGTMFRDLMDEEGKRLTVQPTMGDALLFFPAYANGLPDDRTLHKGDIALDEKMILQMWIHARPYQAVLPRGNHVKDAVSMVESKEKELGYDT